MKEGRSRTKSVGEAKIVRRIFSNLGLLLSGKAAAGLISLLYLVIAARALGARDYGVLILVHGFVLTVGGIVNFPGWHAVVRYGSIALAEHDRGRLVRLLRATALVESGAAVLAILIAAMLAPVVGPVLGWSATAMTLAVPYSLAVLASARSTPAGYLQLMGRFDLLGAHNLVAPLTRLAGAALAAAAGWGLRGFLIAWLIAALAEWLSLWLLAAFVARRALPGERLAGSMEGVAEQNPGLWRFMLAANADITLGELTGRVTPLIVGAILGPAAAGLYAIAQRLTVVISQPAQILGQAAFAELARLVAAGGRGAALRLALLRSVGIALIAGLVLLGLFALFARELVVLVGGPAFAGAQSVLVWLAAARVLLLVAPSVSAALVALGRPGLSASANALASLGLLPLLPFLLLQMGLTGSGMHALLQAGLTSAMLVWLLLRASADPPVTGQDLAAER